MITSIMLPRHRDPLITEIAKRREKRIAWARKVDPKAFDAWVERRVRERDAQLAK